MSLLEKAKSTTKTSKQTITPEHIELAQAFVRGEVGIVAVNVSLGHSNTSIQGYITIARALREDHSEKNKTKITVEEIDNRQLCSKD